MDYTDFLSALIGLLATAVTTFVIPWLKAKLGNERLTKAIEWAKIAVYAAEQIYNGPGRGEEKKQYALDFLAQRGITFDEAAIDALIEASVQEVKKELTA